MAGQRVVRAEVSLTGWPGYNCLRAAVATIADVHIDRVPDPTSFVHDGLLMFDDYSDELAARIGYRFQVLGWGECPPHGRDWIAVMCTSETKETQTTHAVVCRGGQLLHDPSAVFKAYQPSLLEHGLVLVAA